MPATIMRTRGLIGLECEEGMSFAMRYRAVIAPPNEKAVPVAYSQVSLLIGINSLSESSPFSSMLHFSNW